MENEDFEDNEEYELDQELLEKFDDKIQSAIEEVLKEKDWKSIGPELLTILTNLSVQHARELEMDEEDFVEFSMQFFEEEHNHSENCEECQKENLTEKLNEGAEYSINTFIKPGGKPS